MDESERLDFDTPSWTWRVLRTPLGDLLRGRITAEQVKCEIVAAELPPVISKAVRTIAVRTRLWHNEQLDVARELTSHFQEGLDLGRSPEQLLQDFGAERPVAKLIRAAKLRQRPRWWQIWWWVSRTLLAVLALAILGYVVLAARLFLRSPTISHNFWEEANAARRTHPDTRAWPLYRQVAEQLSDADIGLLQEYEDILPNDPQRKLAFEMAERLEPQLAKLRDAAQRPSLGFLYGDPDDREFAKAASRAWHLNPNMRVASDNAMFVEIDLSSLFILRRLNRLLAIDAQRAAVSGDGRTTMADLTAMVSLADQLLSSDSLLVEQLIAIALLGVALDTTNQILRDSPEVFSDEQLRDLAHVLAAFNGGTLQMDVSGDRIFFDDVLQRLYSDDGTGDGRMTAEGLEQLAELARNTEPQIQSIISPAIAALMAGREEERQFFYDMLDAQIAAHRGPPWTWNADDVDAAERTLNAAKQSPLQRHRHLITQILMPAVGSAISAGEVATMQRDATQAAIALVLWHRRHGAWPASLAELVPDLLPAVPVDRYDGQPLRYVVRDGQPLLYSVGGDCLDEGGRAPKKPEDARGAMTPWRLAEVKQGVRTGGSGDWFLWPPVAERPETTSPETTSPETTSPETTSPESPPPDDTPPAEDSE